MSTLTAWTHRRIVGDLSVAALARNIWKEIRKDAVPGRAAQLAFYWTMSFFPLLIFLITLLTFIPGADSFLFGYLDRVLPPEASAIVHTWVKTVFQHGNSGLLSFSLLFTLWSASNGLGALIDVFNVAYEVKEGRPFWKYWLVSVALTLGLALLVLGGAGLFIFGSMALGLITDLLHLSRWLALLTRTMNYAVGLAMLFLGLSLLHYFGPNVKQRWRFWTPGAVFSGLAILAVSYLFSVYLQFAPSYSAVYGGLGAVVIFMLWLFLISLTLLVGAEINDEVRKAYGERTKEREGANDRG